MRTSQSTITDTQLEELEILRDKLAPLYNALNPPPMCWIAGADNGEDFCHDCAKEKLAKLLGDNPDGDFVLDGGWDEIRALDGHCICSSCGKTLQHGLSEYGLQSELGHAPVTQESYPFKDQTDSEVAYSVVTILDAAEWSHSLELIADALACARIAVSNMPVSN